jgi:hypothetical protein
VNKYGIDGIRFSVIEIATEKLFEKEDRWIKYYSSLGKMCNFESAVFPNIKHLRTPQATKKRLDSLRRTSGKDSPKAIPVYCYNKHGEFIRKYDTQRIASQEYGFDESAFKFSLSKEKISFISGFVFSREPLDNTMRNRLKMFPMTKLYFRKKPIVQLSADGKKFIQSWSDSSTASRILKISRGNLHHALNGKQKTCGGYSWKYL